MVSVAQLSLKSSIMTYLSVILLGCLLFFFQGCWCSPQFLPSVGVSCTCTDNKVKINCLLINLEYVNCSWTRPQSQQINYTFHIAFSAKSFHECPKYLQEHGQNVGCRIPLKKPEHRYNPFYTKLSVGGNQAICKNYTDLSTVVKLDPPYNVSVNSSGRESAVCVHWSSNQNHQNCVNYSVSYQKASGTWMSSTVLSSPYCLSPVFKGVVYTFQVKKGMSNYCGTSHYWSEWSEQVQWIDHKDVMDKSQPAYWQVLSFVLGVIILISLSILLCYSERIKVVLVPAAPDPSKSLQDLFKKYNGNVESWVYISRELKDAFEPDYTESPCDVCEPSPTFEDKTVEGPMKQPIT